MVPRKTLLCVKEIEKGNWSQLETSHKVPLLTGILAEVLYKYLEKTNLLPWKQKGSRKGSRDTKDQLLIGNMIVKDCKKWLTTLTIA